jgi:hypothetical protein
LTVQELIGGRRERCILGGHGWREEIDKEAR